MTTAHDHAATFWESHYRDRDLDLDPQPNPAIAAIAESFVPGRVLELACGAGGDALWYARRGWHVTAVDISSAAVAHVATSAGRAGLTDRLTTQQIDLAEDFPTGSFDLISAAFFHTPFAIDRSRTLVQAAHALVPGGCLLVVDHGSTAPWSWNQDPDVHHPTPTEVAADLDLYPSTWTVELAEQRPRVAHGPNGQDAEVTDNVLLIRRSVSG